MNSAEAAQLLAEFAEQELPLSHAYDLIQASQRF